MKNKTREKAPKKIKEFFKRIWGYAVWFLILVLVISVVRNIRKTITIRSAVGQSQAKIDKIKEENTKLEREITQAQGEAFIEKQVRDKLGLVKEGEAIVVLPDEETLRKLAPQPPEEVDTLPDPIWRKWLKLFL